MTEHEQKKMDRIYMYCNHTYGEHRAGDNCCVLEDANGTKFFKADTVFKERISEKPTCQDCGSDDISFDAACRWDVEKQDYVLTSTMDSGGCNNCGHVFKRVNWREI